MQALHFWDYQDVDTFEHAMEEKYPKMIKFIREDVKHERNVQGIMQVLVLT
jgi:hypothetical protein